jgi:hypothetical protein
MRHVNSIRKVPFFFLFPLDLWSLTKTGIFVIYFHHQPLSSAGRFGFEMPKYDNSKKA